jgi:hypothetical protein
LISTYPQSNDASVQDVPERVSTMSPVHAEAVARRPRSGSAVAWRGASGGNMSWGFQVHLVSR